MTSNEQQALAAIESATIPRPPDFRTRPARFVIELAPGNDPKVAIARILSLLAGYAVLVRPLSELSHDLLLVTLQDRIFRGDTGPAFEAAHLMARAVDASSAEPEIIHGLFPEPSPSVPGGPPVESVDKFLPGCWVDEEDGLKNKKRWALAAMNVPKAWAFSEAQGRPSRGAGIVIAQPDTGITVHPELQGVARVPGYDFVDGDADPTDPLDYFGNPGHGTGTASVLVSSEAGDIAGTAPSAMHMSIRAIEAVARVSQISVAQAIDFAVARGAHVISMSLGGFPSLSLWYALKRAVDADVIVLAAAGYLDSDLTSLNHWAFDPPPKLSATDALASW